MPTHRPIEQRFWEKVEKSTDDGCWLWTGCRDWNGYGKIGAPLRSYPLYAHRVSYELTKGVIPSGHMVHHTCHNKLCVNPDHLVLVESAKAHGFLHRKPKPAKPDKLDWDAILAEFEAEMFDRTTIRKMVDDGVSQAAIARRLGISRQRVNQIKSGVNH